jgi:hypothetical protein
LTHFYIIAQGISQKLGVEAKAIAISGVTTPLAQLIALLGK